MTPKHLHLLALGALLALPALAQQFVYPAKGQSPQQQKADEAACHTWAVQQAGDPSKPATTSQAPTTATGTAPGAGARGAVRGAIVAEAVGGEGDKGAAVGAVAARSRSRQANAAAGQQQSQQQGAAYAKARAACLEGKGYTVK
jgi:hypothetical protein